MEEEKTLGFYSLWSWPWQGQQHTLWSQEKSNYTNRDRLFLTLHKYSQAWRIMWGPPELDGQSLWVSQVHNLSPNWAAASHSSAPMCRSLTRLLMSSNMTLTHIRPGISVWADQVHMSASCMDSAELTIQVIASHFWMSWHWLFMLHISRSSFNL